MAVAILFLVTLGAGTANEAANEEPEIPQVFELSGGDCSLAITSSLTVHHILEKPFCNLQNASCALRSPAMERGRGLGRCID